MSLFLSEAVLQEAYGSRPDRIKSYLQLTSQKVVRRAKAPRTIIFNSTYFENCHNIHR